MLTLPILQDMNNNNEYLEKFSIVIVSLPNKEHCVCEIYYNNVQWVEISREVDEPLIQFYANPHQSFWEFPLNAALEILQQAKIKYLEL